MSLLQSIASSKEKIVNLEKKIPLEEHKKRILDIDEIMSNPAIWSQSNKTTELLKERQKLDKLIKNITSFKDISEYLYEYVHTFPNELSDYQKDILELESKVKAFEIEQMFSDPVDNSPAILSIAAGAGGLEAANWVTMLLRMYSRYIDSFGFKAEIIDFKSSEEHSGICTDSVSLRITRRFCIWLF